MKIFNRYFYLIITKKPIPDKRLAAIKEGKAWLRSKDLGSAKVIKGYQGDKGALDESGASQRP